MTSTDLRTRAEQAAGGEVAERVPTGETMARQIQRMEEHFSLAMPRGAEAKQLVRDALTCLRTIRNLDQADPQSVLGSLMTCAQLGLRPGVLGHAWPLPFWDGQKKRYVAQLVIGYLGYIELGYRSPRIAGIVSRTVHEKDVFDIELGTDDRLVHRPARQGDRGRITDFYSVVKLDNGGRTFWHMTRDEMEAWREQYAPRNRQQKIVGPWREDFDTNPSMGMKTTLRRLAKYMPKSTELAIAMQVDDAVRFDTQHTTPAIEVSVHPSTAEPVEEPQGAPAEPAEYDPTAQADWQGGEGR